jgi:hypothetical protein
MDSQSRDRKASVTGPRLLREPGGWLLWGGGSALLLLPILICGWMLARPGQGNLEEKNGKEGVTRGVEGRRVREASGSRMATGGSDGLLKEKVASIRGEEDAERRRALLRGLVEDCAVEEIRGILDELLGSGEDAACVALLRRWAEVDGRAAARWAEGLPAGRLREEALAGVAVVWANQAMTDAAAWAGHLKDGPERESAVLAVAGEALRSDPVEALRLAMDLPANAQQEELVRHGAMEWAAQDAPAAAQWARQITDESLRERAMAAIATEWSTADPVAAATLAMWEISKGKAQSDAVMGIVQRWAQTQPDQAAAWVARFPEGELKETALENLEVLGAVGEK